MAGTHSRRRAPTRRSAAFLEKVWGREDLPAWCAARPGARIGEAVFAPVGVADGLLVKYLFTSEALSVQVHPDDAQARRRGHAGGKEEAWLVLSAEPGARLALGLVEEIGRAELRRAATDGSLERMLDWTTAAPGDVFHVPPGTIHAIGGGLSLVEVQQNADITYRLYDYGRPRELHLDDAVDVARPGPSGRIIRTSPETSGSRGLLEGRHFSISLLTGPGRFSLSPEGALALIPLSGRCQAGPATLPAGSVWDVVAPIDLELEGAASLLVARGRAA